MTAQLGEGPDAVRVLQPTRRRGSPTGDGQVEAAAALSRVPLSVFAPPTRHAPNDCILRMEYRHPAYWVVRPQKAGDPPPMKWSDSKYGFAIEEDCSDQPIPDKTRPGGSNAYATPHRLHKCVERGKAAPTASRSSETP
jgi:hypothetical protein